MRNSLYSIINFPDPKIKPPGNLKMPKLKLPDIEKVTAIDIHTHAEEPCGMHGDDGYDDFQAKMAEYFSRIPMPPGMPEPTPVWPVWNSAIAPPSLMAS